MHSTTPRNRENRRQGWTTVVFHLLLAAVCAVAVSAQKIELCDGVDNNGNGVIDEGFDIDGDGVARCCSEDPFFATVDSNQQQIDVHYRSCAASGFTAGITSAFQDPSTRIQIHGVGDYDGNCGLDILWRDVGANYGQRHLTTCSQGEWQTRKLEYSEFNFFGGADLNGDQTLDLVGHYYSCCYISAPKGVTALNGGGGLPMFTDFYGSYDLSPIDGDWQAGRAYNAEDVDGDGIPDLLFWGYSSGGSSSTELHFSLGAPPSFTLAASPVATLAEQPQNFGDMGDIDGDRCVDWVGGPDDDGNRGGAYALYGDCAGGFTSPNLLVDTCVGCSGSGNLQGAGMSQLYDWNCDGSLDLLVSRIVNTGSSSEITYWENNGSGGFPGSPTATPVPTTSIVHTFASPLRNY